MINKINEHIYEFLALYAQRPSVRNLNGLEYEGSLVLWTVLRSLPEVSTIIESGVSIGVSSWLIEQTRPDCRLIHIEPNAASIQFKTRGLYLTEDFTHMTKETLGHGPAFAFFDDHQDILPRLEKCLELGIEHTLWDDNWDCPRSDHMSQRLYNKFNLATDIKARWEKVKSKFAETFEFTHVGDLHFSSQPYNPHETLTYIRLEK